MNLLRNGPVAGGSYPVPMLGNVLYHGKTCFFAQLDELCKHVDSIAMQLDCGDGRGASG